MRLSINSKIDYILFWDESRKKSISLIYFPFLYNKVKILFFLENMLKRFFSHFNKLPESNKAMVYLMWIYGVGELISTTFVNIYIFKINNSFLNTIIYNLLFFSSTFLGFSFLWWIMSRENKNIKNMYYISYVLFILAFVELLSSRWSLIGGYIFWIIFAFWNGAFWNAVHTQELKNINNKNRDFYSSSISAGKNIIAMIIPFFVSFVFLLGKKFDFDGYIILFLFLPLVYLCSFLFINKIESYIPQKIETEDLKNFFNLKKYKYGHIYFLIGWFLLALNTAVMPIINLVLLKNEVNIGLFQWILVLFSTYFIIHLSHKRQEETRLQYFFIICLLVSLNFISFGIWFSFVNFLIFSIVFLFIAPLRRVSEHVYDLSLMDNIKTDNNDFYPAMILRESILWIGRIIALLVLLFFANSKIFDNEAILRIWLIIEWIGVLLLFISIYLWEKYEKDNT